MKIDIRITSERMNKYITLDEMIGFDARNVKVIREVLPRFLWNSETNDYFPVTIETDSDGIDTIKSDPRASKMIGNLTMEKISEIAGQFSDKAGIAANTSPTNGEGFNSSISQA